MGKKAARRAWQGAAAKGPDSSQYVLAVSCLATHAQAVFATGVHLVGP